MSRLQRLHSAITGRFVKRSTARRHPDTTVAVTHRRERRGPELADAVLLAAAEALLDTQGTARAATDGVAVSRLELERLAEAVELVTTGGAHG